MTATGPESDQEHRLKTARLCLDRLGHLLEEIADMHNGFEDLGHLGIENLDGDLELPPLIVDAVEEAKKAFENMDETSPEADRVQGYVLYAAALFEAHKYKPQISGISDAVKLLRQALETCPEHDPDRAIYCQNLADTLREQYEMTLDKLCLDEMIVLQSEVLLHLQADSKPLPHALACVDLAASLNLKYKHTGTVPLLDQAINLLREALASRVIERTQYRQPVSNLIYSLQSMFARTGNSGFLNESIELQRAYHDFLRDLIDKDCGVGQQRSASMLSETYVSLAVSLRLLNKRSNDFSIQSETINLLRQAWSRTTREHPLRALICEELGRALHAQYHVQGVSRSVTEFEPVPVLKWNGPTTLYPNFPNRPTLLVEDWTPLDEPARLYREALDHISDGHPDKMLYFGNLSIILQEYSRKELWPEALSLQRKACSLCPKEDQHRVNLVESLSLLLRRYYELRPDDTLLHEANDLQREALALRQEAEQNWGPICENLLNAFKLHYNHSSDDHALAKVAALCHELMIQLPPQVTWKYVTQLVWVHMQKGSSLYDTSMARAYLRQILKCDAHIKLSALPTMLDLISDMSESNDMIAHERGDAMFNQSELLPIYQGLAQLMFNDSYHKLCSAASTGTIVALVNVQERYRAVIFRNSTFHSLITLNISSWGIQDIPGHGHSSDSHTLRFRGFKFRKVPRTLYTTLLRKTWFAIAFPILRHLRIEPAHSKGSARPHLRWYCTGVFSRLPIHAAGVVVSDGRRLRRIYCSDYVVSSYISCGPRPPTIPKECRRPYLPCSDIRLALVGDPGELSGRQIHDLPFLPDIKREIEEIETIARANEVQVIYRSTHSNAVNEVVKVLAEANTFHLACHALVKPLGLSGFILGDGELTIQHLEKMPLKDAFLAVLSACDTQVDGGYFSIDEDPEVPTISLVHAMLSCGFQNVIATMWRIADEDAAKISTWFYSELFGHTRIDRDTIAHALDTAISKLRNSGVSDQRWAPFMYSSHWE